MTGPAGAVGYLGPAGTVSHEALLAASGQEGEPLATIDDVVEAVAAGRVARGLVPVENSVEGVVTATLDALVAAWPAVRVVGEHVHGVRHALLAAPGAGPSFAAVVSHPQVLAQCRAYLRRAHPAATVVPAPSSADAMRQVAGRPDWAALGPASAAERYGLEVVATAVQDSDRNATRFMWLAPDGEAAADADAGAGAGGRAKTALAFWGRGTGSAGWLVRCLSELAFRGVNLTLIQSRPRRDASGDHLFYLEADGAEADPAVAEALAGLRAQADEVRVLGSFPAA